MLRVSKEKAVLIEKTIKEETRKNFQTCVKVLEKEENSPNPRKGGAGSHVGIEMQL